MTSPKTLFLITVSVLSSFAIGLESRESFINYKAIIGVISRQPRSSVIAVEKAGLETAVGVIRRKLNSEAAIKEIHKVFASLSAHQQNGDSLMAEGAIRIEEGLKAAIELLTASSDAVDKALVSAIQKSFDNPEAAIADIQKGMKTAEQLIYAISFPVYYSFDSAGIIIGDESKNWKRLGLEFVEHGITYAIACLDAAEALSTNGLRSNLAAAGKGLDAAQGAAITGYKAALASLVLAGKSVLKGHSEKIDKQLDKQICESPSIITPRSAESKAAENAIILNAEQFVQSISSQGAVASALSKIEEGLICGIRSVAAGEVSALRAISTATKIALIEPDIAIATFKAGVKALKLSIITAGNETYQGLDEAAVILGNQKINKLVAVSLKVKNGIASALAGVETVEKLTPIGLKISEDVAEQAMKAVYKSILAVSFVFYSLLVTIGEEVFCKY